MNNFPPNLNLSKSVIDSIFEGVSRAVAPGAGQKTGKKKKGRLEVTMRNQFPNRDFDQASGSASLNNQPAIPKVKIPTKLQLRSGTELNLNEGQGIFQTCNVNNFNPKLLNASNCWHMVIVHHFRRVNKVNILYHLNELAKDNLFVAYCYTEGIKFDFFLVYNQDKFLLELVRNSLKVNIELEEISLELRLRVGVVMPAHPKFGIRSIAVIRNRIEQAASLGGEDVFDLSSFSSLMSEHDIDASLSNPMVSSGVFNQMNGIEALKQKFRVFKFAQNDLSSLEAFNKLFGFTNTEPWRILDLSYNNLESIQVFNELKNAKLHIKELLLRGNEVTKIPMYRDKIRKILPEVSIIDSEDAVLPQRAMIPPAPTVGVIKLDLPIPVKQPKAKFNNGAGNNSIAQIEEGVLIRRDANKRSHDPQWTHLRDSFQSYRNDSKWTQVIVHHGGLFNSQEIFDELVANVVNTVPFFPCFHKHFLEHEEFYLFKNFDALNVLMKNDLEHVMPNDRKITFSLRLNAASFVDGQTNWYGKINYVVNKRLKNGVLNLDDFSNDPDFSKMKISLNSKYALNFVLDSAKRHGSAISKISARNNEISTFEYLQPLIHYTQLLTLDLRNNKITTLEGTYSKSMSITELLLDGNPICMRYTNPQAYVAEVRANFASLEMLDECRIDKMLDLVLLQNYFVKRQSYTFAGEFVKTFIPIYDSFERHRLLEMYTDRSIFTLSFHYPYNRDVAQDNVHSRIQKYIRYARNLDLLSDFDKSGENVIVGKKNISKVFTEMSKTNHDMSSLCVEVLMYEPTKFIILKLSGVFEEQGQSLNESTLNMGFARTFYIIPVDNNQFAILNDQLFVHKSNSVVKKIRRGENELLKEHCADILPTENEEKKLKLILFKELTELHEAVCIKHLEESFWDIKIALATFNTLMESDSIKECDFNFK